MIVRHERWTPLHNNCSGKHTGFMTLARHLGAPVAGYQLIDHPAQRMVEKTLKEMAGLSGDLPYGVDGCTVPNFALSLTALARAMAQFADTSATDAIAAGGGGPRRARDDGASGAGRGNGAGVHEPDASVARTWWSRRVRRASISRSSPRLGSAPRSRSTTAASRASETVIAALLIALGAVPDEGAAASLARAPVPNTRGVPVGERRARLEAFRGG